MNNSVNTEPSGIDKSLSENHAEIARILIKQGLLQGPAEEVTFCPLSGGVSSDIFLVEDKQHKMVLKQALPKLRVKDDWYADVERNRYEHEYLRYVAGLDAGIVPKVLYYNDEKGFFVMEYLSEGFSTWKTLLLNKEVDEIYAVKSGEVLGKIHRKSWDSDILRKAFDTTDQFIQLRVDPYLFTTGQRWPELRVLFDEEGHRLTANKKCLVHGDYSPKNLLVGHDQIVVIDCEVAWFGDPTFDVCFLLNHLFLKAIHNNEIAEQYLTCANSFWYSYSKALGIEHLHDVEPHVGRLLLMLMAARVDGKSPAEYLRDENKKNHIRNFVKQNLKNENIVDPVRKLSGLWFEFINTL